MRSRGCARGRRRRRRSRAAPRGGGAERRRPTPHRARRTRRRERSLRRAESDARILEETHRLVTQAAQAVPGEFAAARTALRQASATREQLEPADAARLGGELRAIDAELTPLETDAARRPTRTIDRIARLRDRLDLALGDARTAQQRLRGARTALPGTLAAARNADRAGRGIRRPRPRERRREVAARLGAARARRRPAGPGSGGGAGCRAPRDARRRGRAVARRLRPARRSLTRAGSPLS